MGGGASVASSDQPDYLPKDKTKPLAYHHMLLAVKLAFLNQLSYQVPDLVVKNKTLYRLTESECKTPEKAGFWQAADSLGVKEFDIWEDYTEVKDKDGSLTGVKVYTLAFTGLITATGGVMIPFICFRGTASTSDMMQDLKSIVLTDFVTGKGQNVARTGLGFRDQLAKFRKLPHPTLRSDGKPLFAHITGLMTKCKQGLLITGHSLGGAVATLFTLELVKDYPALAEQQDLQLITFGAPRVFPKKDAQAFNDLPVGHLRFVNEKDFITSLPPWHTFSLYHTGNCCYAADHSHAWYTIHTVKEKAATQSLASKLFGKESMKTIAKKLQSEGNDLFAEVQKKGVETMNDALMTGGKNLANNPSEGMNKVNEIANAELAVPEVNTDDLAGDLAGKLMQLKMPEADRVFNMAADGHINGEDLGLVLSQFLAGGADYHLLGTHCGYLYQLVGSGVKGENNTRYEAALELLQAPERTQYEDMKITIGEPSFLKESMKSLTMFYPSLKKMVKETFKSE